MRQIAKAAVLAAVTGGIGFGSIAEAAPIVDHFVTGSDPSTTYIAGSDINGQGPAVTGFTGTWSATASRYAPSSTGDMPTGNYTGATGGGVVATDTTTNSTRGFTRNLTDGGASITGGGSGTGALYVSGLVDFTSMAGNGQNSTVQLVAGGASLQIQNASGGTTPSYVVNGTGGQNNTLTITPGTNYLFVIKLSLASGATSYSTSGNETVSSWILNADGTLPASETAPLTSGTYNALGGSGTLLNGGVGFNGKLSAVTYDELRVGSTWSDVVPVPAPEPATASLIGGVAMLLSMRRRRN